MKTTLLLALLAAAAAPARAAEAAPAAPPPEASPRPPAGQVLTLAEAVRTALEHQPQLLQARAGTSAAEARADQARSGLLPRIDAAASYTRATSNGTSRGGLAGSSSSSFGASDFWQAGATLSQLIYDFGQTSGRWRAAQASAAGQRATEQSTRQQVLEGVQAAYFTARAGRDLLAVARDNLANQDAHLAQIEGFVRAGARPSIDLAQARADRANAQVQLINAENAYLTEKAQLQQAMGVEGPTDFEVASETLPPVPGEELGLDALLEQALRVRPDVAALEQQARAQELTLGAIRGAYAPQLGVSTGLTEGGPGLDALAWNWSATVNLTWNLFQGGLTSAQVREAQATREAVRAQAVALRQQVRVEVEQARLGVRAARQSLASADEALVNARERLRLAEARYRTGVGSAIELGDAQVAYTTTAAQRVQAEYALSTSRAQLLRALGRAGEA